MHNKKLGILLSTPPSHLSVRTVHSLCEEALNEGIDVYLYLIDEGVMSLRDSGFTELSRNGMKLFVCAYGCQQHRVSTEGLDPGITLCGLVVLDQIINGCDRFLAFN
ncbi:MAG: DsrE family protein [Nitrospiraceae bacterium]